MANDSIVFNPRRPFQVYWFKMPSGQVQSFRFKSEETCERVGELLAAGATLIPDPFRRIVPSRSAV